MTYYGRAAQGGRALPLLAIEGIDKAGKDTQSRFLERKLAQKRFKVKRLAFPDYETHLGKEIGKFLQGKINLGPEVRQLLYVANRWEREKDMREWLRDGMFVIADRYIPSGLAYGLANGLSLDWMLKLEEGLPVVDAVILVDISVETSLSRGWRKDIYEEDRKFLDGVRSAYLDLAKRFGWIVVNGEASVEDVSQAIWREVEGHFRI